MDEILLLLEEIEENYLSDNIEIKITDNLFREKKVYTIKNYLEETEIKTEERFIK